MTEAPITVVIPEPREQRRSVYYLGEIGVDVGIKNDLEVGIIIDRISLAFQSDSRWADPRTTISQHFGDFEILPSRLEYREIRVRPSLLFLKFSNYFKVRVEFRRLDKPDYPQKFTTQGPYLIVSPSPPHGSVFISYAETRQDRKLADDFAELAKRAGYLPYLASADKQLGSEIWRRKIPKAIRSSDWICFIWTSKTSVAPGVKREIRIARRLKKPEILLLEKGCPLPREFPQGREYLPFSRRTSKLDFAKALEAKRRG